MLDFIITLGQVVVGLIALFFILICVIAGGIELYDKITGADVKKQDMQKRLKSVEEDYS